MSDGIWWIQLRVTYGLTIDLAKPFVHRVVRPFSRVLERHEASPWINELSSRLARPDSRVAERQEGVFGQRGVSPLQRGGKAAMWDSRIYHLPPGARKGSASA